VQVCVADNSVLARRSDGEAVAWGWGTASSPPPPLDPGTSYLRIAGGVWAHMAIVGRESRYVTVAPGCAGSRPSCRLIPRDTPQIGRTLTVGLTNLPASLAVLVMGWSRITPAVPLDTIGMPGCLAHVPLDGTALLSGSNGEASWSLPIPFQPALLGTVFYHQALVVDPAAGNAFGAVVSEVAEAVVGG
jgi:hypothetical protein